VRRHVVLSRQEIGGEGCGKKNVAQYLPSIKNTSLPKKRKDALVLDTSNAHQLHTVLPSVWQGSKRNHLGDSFPVVA